jgi:hypothetical protein
VINGNGTAFQMELAANVTNAGLIEGTTSQGLFIHGATLTNSGTIAALGAGAMVVIANEAVANSTGKALIPRFRQWGAGGTQQRDDIGRYTENFSRGGRLRLRALP